MNRVFLLLVIFLLAGQPALAGRAKLAPISQDPYLSALVIDADSGKVLFEDQAGTKAYPASVLKLMDLLIILEYIEQGRLGLSDMVQVTKEAAQMGGSQVYLDPKEQFSVEDLLYALMVQSANDAAVALATHVAGSKEGFVALMNQRAEQLGMKDTRFSSVHGLPPSEGQKPDVTTAYDLSILGRELAKRPDVFEYTGITERDFRGGEFVMRTHNHLLSKVIGCDGFKTGYFRAAGFSIMATAKRSGVRLIVVVMGSTNRKVRDAKAIELLAKGFTMVPPKPEKTIVAAQPQTKQELSEEKEEIDVPDSSTFQPVQASPEESKTTATTDLPTAGWKIFLMGLASGMVLYRVLTGLFASKKPKRYSNFRR